MHEDRQLATMIHRAALAALIKRLGGEVVIKPDELSLLCKVDGEQREDGTVWLRVK